MYYSHVVFSSLYHLHIKDYSVVLSFSGHPNFKQDFTNFYYARRGRALFSLLSKNESRLIIFLHSTMAGEARG
jgi:hypothetical protein